MSFGTRDEKLEKESTIKQIEQLNRESSVLSKDYDSLALPDDFSDMEVSEGELPSYDQIPGAPEDGINIRRSQLKGNKRWNSHADIKTISSQAPDAELDDGRRKTGTNLDISTPKKTKRSLLFHGRHYHYWLPHYLHIRPHHFSPYYDFPEEPIDPIPSISHFMDFPRFPTPKRLPKFPLSLMAERFAPYPPLPKIDEYSPPPLEKLERLPQLPPIPQAILDREETGTRDPEPIDEWAPLPEPVPAPEPPPIPELAPIKEIPPIAEPEEKTPPNLDPKKTFGTGESNGGVKKSSSEGKEHVNTTGLPTSI